MVHGELIKAGKVAPLTFRQLKRLEKIDANKAREGRLFSLVEHVVDGGSNVLGRSLEGTITGPIVLALLLVGTYGWAPTRTLIERVFQGAAYGAAQGWKNSIEPALGDIPGIAPFFSSSVNQSNPPPGTTETPNCSSQTTFLKYSPIYSWTRSFFNSPDQDAHAIATWETYNALDLVGNLVRVKTCVYADGTGYRTFEVVKYAPGHSDIDNPANSSFYIPGAPPPHFARDANGNIIYPQPIGPGLPGSP
jgi:hypothetical protein